jgi:hypothetical protein
MKLAGKQIFSDPKKVVIISLVPVIVGLLWLGFSNGIAELSLPYAAQIDELRLTDPDRVKAEVPNASSVSPDLPEAQLINILACRDKAGENCSSLVLDMLHDDPANGRLWLEYARLLAQENGLNESAIFALRKSYQLSPREGWIANTRTKFSLSVWLELPADVKELASQEILSAMENYQFIGFLADIYLANPISRNALKEVVEKATPEHQKSFLGLVNKKSNG